MNTKQDKVFCIDCVHYRQYPIDGETKDYCDHPDFSIIRYTYKEIQRTPTFESPEILNCKNDCKRYEFKEVAVLSEM